VFALQNPTSRIRIYSKGIPHIFDSKWFDLSVADIWWQIATEWLIESATVTMESVWKPQSLLRMVPSLTLYDLPFPSNGVPNATLVICRILNGHISDPLHVWFYRVEFSGRLADGSNGTISDFPVRSNPRWQPATAALRGFFRQHGFLVYECHTFRGYAGPVGLWSMSVSESSET